MHNHRGWNMSAQARAPVEGWYWPQASSGPDGDFPAHLIAEGLTETECRLLSGLSVTDALMWCATRPAAQEETQ
jgi:hypothetical protein